MPTYDYKCQECNTKYAEIHSINDGSQGCPECGSDQVEKMVSLFASKTEQSFDKALELYEQQGKKDLDRFNKDDKFAANVTGASDPNHHKKLQKVINDQVKKNNEARKKIKRIEQ